MAHGECNCCFSIFAAVVYFMMIFSNVTTFIVFVYPALFRKNAPESGKAGIIAVWILYEIL
jgi:hypothetical protein